MVTLDSRLNMKKEKIDIQDLRLDIFGYDVKETDKFTLIVRENEISKKEYSSYATQDNSIFFKIDNTIEDGEYTYDVVMNDNYAIIYNRDLIVRS